MENYLGATELTGKLRCVLCAGVKLQGKGFTFPDFCPALIELFFIWFIYVPGRNIIQLGQHPVGQCD